MIYTLKCDFVFNILKMLFRSYILKYYFLQHENQSRYEPQAM
jgi:hypothetical protein